MHSFSLVGVTGYRNRLRWSVQRSVICPVDPGSIPGSPSWSSTSRRHPRGNHCKIFIPSWCHIFLVYVLVVIVWFPLTHFKSPNGLPQHFLKMASACCFLLLTQWIGLNWIDLLKVCKYIYKAFGCHMQDFKHRLQVMLQLHSPPTTGTHPILQFQLVNFGCQFHPYYTEWC